MAIITSHFNTIVELRDSLDRNLVNVLFLMLTWALSKLVWLAKLLSSKAKPQKKSKTSSVEGKHFVSTLIYFADQFNLFGQSIWSDKAAVIGWANTEAN